MAPSSDLYVASNGNAPNSQDTGKSAGVQYAVGSADGLFCYSHFIHSLVNSILFAGPVRTADLDFLGYTVSDQAFSMCLLFPIGLVYSILYL